MRCLENGFYCYRNKTVFIFFMWDKNYLGMKFIAGFSVECLMRWLKFFIEGKYFHDYFCSSSKLLFIIYRLNMEIRQLMLEYF